MAVTRTSSRSEIRAYQTQLNEAGATPPLVIDGIWGPKTQAAHEGWGETAETPVDATGDDAALLGTGEENDPRFGLAGGAELWKDTTTGEVYIVYIVPGTEADPVYMRWTVPSDEDVQSFFGPGQVIVYQQEYAGDDDIWGDTIDFGSSTDIANVAANPFDSWASTLEVEAASQPWILDDDYQQLLAMAVIEGRPLTQAEIESTQWYEKHSEAERKWMSTYNGDPATAQQQLEDKRLLVEEQLLAAGMGVIDPMLVNYMADAVTTGLWSAAELSQQIQIMSDPFFKDTPLKDDFRSFLADNSLSYTQTSDMENEVRSTVQRWLGTNFGDWSDEEVANWAARIRNDPNSMEALVETLKDQKEALFAGYDREADYDTIASPWRTMMRNSWGEVPNDSDQTLQSIIRMNDAAEAGKLLTTEGLKRGNEYVVNSVQSDLNSAFGGA